MKSKLPGNGEVQTQKKRRRKIANFIRTDKHHLFHLGYLGQNFLTSQVIVSLLEYWLTFLESEDLYLPGAGKQHNASFLKWMFWEKILEALKFCVDPGTVKWSWSASVVTFHFYLIKCVFISFYSGLKYKLLTRIKNKNRSFCKLTLPHKGKETAFDQKIELQSRFLLC